MGRNPDITIPRYNDIIYPPLGISLYRGPTVLVRDRVDWPPCWMRAERGLEARKSLTPTTLGPLFSIPNPLPSKNSRWRPIKMHLNMLT